MTVYNWLTLLGIPGFGAAFVAYLIVYFKQLRMVKNGIQAILRNDLYELYDKAVARGGKTTRRERENFENIYVNYHGLGQNGVMTDLRDRYFAFEVLAEE